MLKKIVLGTLFTGLLSALVAGAVIRTADRVDRVGDGEGQQGRGRNAQVEVGEQGRQAGGSGGGSGNSQGSGQGGNGGGSQGANGGGGQGSGQGGNAEGRNTEGGNTEASRRQGNGGSNGQGNGQTNGQAIGSGQGDGIGLESVEDWLTLEGAVTAVDESELVLQVADGELIVDGRAWLYALEQGFSTEEGREVAVTGFWEDGEFKPVELVDTTAGSSVVVRDEGGRPYWSGQGRGAGSS